jgi:hypothetical protein
MAPIPVVPRIRAAIEELGGIAERLGYTAVHHPS